MIKIAAHSHYFAFRCTIWLVDPDRTTRNSLYRLYRPGKNPGESSPAPYFVDCVMISHCMLLQSHPEWVEYPAGDTEKAGWWNRSCYWWRLRYGMCFRLSYAYIWNEALKLWLINYSCFLCITCSQYRCLTCRCASIGVPIASAIMKTWHSSIIIIFDLFFSNVKQMSSYKI